MNKKSHFVVFSESNKSVEHLTPRRLFYRFQMRLIAFAILLLLQIINVYGKDKRSLSPDDAIRVVRIGDVLMTPDGETVFYSESHLDWDKNKYKKTFYMIPSKGGTPHQFIGKDGGKDLFDD